MATIVLVHGAGTGAWLWDRVVPLLDARGHRVMAPTLSGIGERSPRAGRTPRSPPTRTSWWALLPAAPSVLVGFSYGGAVIAGAADRAPERVARLVFLDAFLPVPGRSMLDLMPAPVAAAMRGAAEAGGDGWRVPPVPLEQLGDLGDIEDGIDRDGVLALLAARRGPQPLGTYAEAASPPAPGAAALPRTYVSCPQKRPEDPTLAMAGLARRAGWDVAELPAGHFAMLTMPERLAGLLDALSR